MAFDGKLLSGVTVLLAVVEAGTGRFVASLQDYGMFGGYLSGQRRCITIHGRRF